MESDHTGHSCRLDFAGSLYPQKEAADSCSIKGCDKINFSHQCCDLTLCPYHWRNYCDVKKWDHHLSKCANEKCDILKIAEREKINQHNIWSILNIPGNNSYCHISTFRRTQTVAFAKRKASDVDHNSDTNVSQTVVNPKEQAGRISEIESKNLPIKKRHRVYLEENPNNDALLQSQRMNQFMEYLQELDNHNKKLSTFRENFKYYIFRAQSTSLKNIVTSILKEKDIEIRKQITEGVQQKIKTAISALFDVYRMPIALRTRDANEIISLQKSLIISFNKSEPLPDIITDEIILHVTTFLMQLKILLDEVIANKNIANMYLYSTDNYNVIFTES